MDSSRHIGPNIRRLRQAQGLTQGKLADLAGISRVRLNVIENGQNTGTLLVSTIDSVSQALGVETAELYRAAKEPAA